MISSFFVNFVLHYPALISAAKQIISEDKTEYNKKQRTDCFRNKQQQGHTHTEAK